MTKERLGLFKKVAILTCIGLSLTFTTAFAEENDSLEKVFHVYVDGKHVGKVDNEKVVQNLIDTKVTNKEKVHKDFPMVIDEKVSLVPELVFNPTYSNKKVTNLLKENLTVKAEAIKVTIAGQTVGFFKNRETADKALKAYKLKYVDRTALEKLQAKKEDKAKESEPLKSNKHNDNALAVGESTITDVSLSEKVSFSSQEVAPSKLLTVKEGLNKLEEGTVEEKVHKVEKGEVLGSIASEYDLSVNELLELNNELNEDSILQIGQEIHVTDHKPFVSVVVKKEKKIEKVIDYQTEVIESDDLYKGDKEIKQEGQEGKKKIQYAVKIKNGKVINKETIQTKTTKEPNKKIIIKGTKVVPSRGSGDLHWPTVGGYVSSTVGMRWGSMHKGMDIAQPSSPTILAADNGTVVSAGWDSGGYGNKIIINHNNGMRTVYAHLSSISVSPGQTVEKGQKIGVMGSTGNSTGVHLHFELYKDGSLQHPKNHF